MSTYTFPAGASPRLYLADCAGELTINAWDERSIAIEAADGLDEPAQEGDALVVKGARGNLRLRVPSDTSVTVQGQRGAVYLHEVFGDVLVDGAESFRITGEKHWRHWLRHWPGRSHNVEVRNVGAVDIAYTIGNLTIADVQTANARAVGGNVNVRTVAGELHIGSVGGSCSAHAVGGDLQIDNVGGNCQVGEVTGSLGINNVGGSVDISAVGAIRRLGNIGGNLELHGAPLSSDYAREHSAHVIVGGNARIELPDQPNLTIRAMVGGRVAGEGISRDGGGMVTLVYAEGAARLTMVIGGNLDIVGGGAPRSVGTFPGEWAEFGKEMGRQGKELGRMGRKLGRELGGVGRELGRELGGLGREIGRELGGLGREIGRELGRELGGLGREIGRTVTEPLDAEHERPERRATRANDPETREQRAAILRMVAEGRITAEEGAALLRALG